MNKKKYLKPETETVVMKGDVILQETSWTPDGKNNLPILTPGSETGNHDDDYGTGENAELARPMRSVWSCWDD